MGLLQTLAFTTYGLYVVNEVGLEPRELVLAGTALEGAVLVSEVPTGVVADVYADVVP